MALLDTIRALRVRWHAAVIALLLAGAGVVQEVGVYQVRELLGLFISDDHLLGIIMIVLPLALAFLPSVLHKPDAAPDAAPTKGVDQGP